MFFNNKKASAAVIVLFTIVIVVGLFLFLNYASRECNLNTDCNEDFYCGSDFKCHEKEIIEKIIVKNKLLAPSIIIALGLVITAVIFNIDKIKELELNRKIPEMIRKTKHFIENRFFRKEDFPKKKFKDNFSDVAKPDKFGEYR